MRKVYKTISLIAIIIVSFSGNNVLAQQKNYTSKQALNIFEKGDYIEAEEAYAFLLKKYPREPNYNFYMGICQLNNKTDISGSIKKLNYARVKNVSRNVYYYLGKAHRANFQFDEAIRNFSTFLKYSSSKDKRIGEVKELIEICRTSQKLSSKIYKLSVLDKSVSHRDSILELYYPASDVGSIMLNKDFFDSGVKPDGTLFITERKNVVYYTSDISEEDTMSIFKMEKLLDGWGSSVAIGHPVNSEYNDAYPFIETDGVTLYFASDRPGGFGGFDIYKTYFDVESQSYVEPINLGVPFNSPEDDFLFVADEFNGVAWFASNRETNGEEVMVYTVKWDGSQIRNMAENANQVTDAAMLRIEGESENDRDVGFTYSEKKKRSSIKADFELNINDSIKYTHFEDFLSADALSLFRESFKKQQQRDELALLMKEKRKEYAANSIPEEQNKLVTQILELESQVYKLDDEIQEDNISVRYIELQEIKKQLQEGTYQEKDPSNDNAPDDITLVVPAKYNYLVGDEFEQHSSQLEEMYKTLFSESDIEELYIADSLYVWANLLNMESSNILEQSSQVEEQTSVKISSILKKEQVESVESESSSLINESKELKVLSAKLYHKALDKKYPIYWLKLKDEGSNNIQISNLAGKGNTYFNEANSILSKVGGVTMSEYEKAGAMKRSGIESQEKALFIYAESLSANTKLTEPKEVKGAVQKSYSELQNGNKVYEKSSEAVTKSNTDIEYRVQIGVFRNAPNSDSLAKIPPTSTIEIPSKGLTKYMSGHFTTQADAEAAIDTIEAAGFTGAYVVGVKDGKVIPIP